MATNNMDINNIKSLNAKLQWANDMMNEWHVKIIKKASKELLDIFTKPDNVADFSLKDDIKETKKILEDRKNSLASKKAIKKSEITSANTPDGIMVAKEVVKSIELQMKMVYEDKLAKQFKSPLPMFVNFRDEMRKHPDYKINDLETVNKADTNNIKNIYDALQAKDMFKSSSSPEIKEKLTRLIILFAQLDLFIEKWATWTTKNQLDAANKILEKITLVCKQLKAHEATEEALEEIKNREESIDALETTNPKDLPKETPEKATKKNISIEIKDHFLDPAKWLTELPTWYELSQVKFKDTDDQEIELFENITGKKFEKTLKPGEPAVDIFVKDKKGGYIKIGKIEIPWTAPTQIQLEIEAYKDLPVELKFPTTIDMEVKWIGGKWKTLTDKVSISKKLSLWLNKPAFDTEYTNIDNNFDINKKLDKIFQEQYIAQLKDRFFEFMASNELTKWEWNGEPGKRDPMSSDERNQFFQDTIMKTSNPSRLGAGIYGMITNVNQANCYGNIAFAKDFQERILEIFTGKTESDLKKLIFEKLWNLDFPELNPEYAIKILADKVKEKYTIHQEWLYQALNAYMLAVRGGWLKVKQEKLYDWSWLAVKEIKAVVADSKEISKEDAYKNALKKIEDEYKSWVKFWYTRAKIFFFREKMLKNLIAKELKGKWGLHMDDTTNSAVNRWATEKSMGGSFAENIVDVEKDTTEKIFDDPIFQQELDVVVWKYVNGTTVDDATFQTEIEELIDGNAELRNYMKKNKITHLGTNIIQQAKAEKAERSYYKETIDIIDNYSKLWMSNKPQEFEKEIRSALEKFMKEQNKLPDMVKQLWLNIDKIDFATKLATHRTTLETMRLRTVKMRLALLVNKKEVKEAKWRRKEQIEEHVWLTTAQYVNRDKFDVKHATKFTRWMEKHPRWTTGITALWMVGTGVVGALTTPVFGAIGWASILWYLNFLKKKGHYTQEHKKFEETLLAMTPEQRKAYLEDLKEHSEKRPARIRRAFPTRYSKYGKSMEYFENVDSVDSSTKKIQKYLEKSWPLTAIEKQAFQRNLVDAISLLQAHKEKGRNFMYGKEGNTEIEQRYDELYKIILAGVTRYNPLAKNPETVVAKILSSVKTSANVNNNMDEYDRDYKKMRLMRGWLWVMAWTKSAWIYLGSAYALWWIKNHVMDARNNVFGTHNAVAHTAATTTTTVTTANPNIIPSTPGTTTMVLDPAFWPNGELLKAQIFNGDITKFNAFVAKVQTIPTGSHSEKLWSIFKDMYGTDQLANAKTHDFFNMFAGRITDMPLSSQQELIRLWTNFNLHTGNQISNLMTHRWYHGMVTNPSDISSLLAGFKSGAIDLNNLPVGWTKETAANVLFCNTQWDQLTDLIFDTVKAGGWLPPVVPPVLPPVVPPLPPIHPLPPSSGAGRWYKNFLSFWVPTVWNEVNKFNTNEPTPAATNNDTDE